MVFHAKTPTSARTTASATGKDDATSMLRIVSCHHPAVILLRSTLRSGPLVFSALMIKNATHHHNMPVSLMVCAPTATMTACAMIQVDSVRMFLRVVDHHAVKLSTAARVQHCVTVLRYRAPA